MASSLLALRDSKLPHRIAQASVRYAGRREGAGGDQRLEIIRRALYPSNIRNKPSPTGTWRPDVARRLQRAIPSKQAHETIERAWFLRERHVRRTRQAELTRKFECMRKAMETLRLVNPTLYKEANQGEDPRVKSEAEIQLAKTLSGPERRVLETRIRGLFPREMRIPVDTPPRGGWNYEWTPLIRTQTS